MKDKNMEKNGSNLSKILVIITALTLTISLSTFPLFSWANPLKHNLAIIITLIVNKEPIISNFYKQLMISKLAITVYSFVTLLIFNLTYLIPLIFIKKPFAKSLFAIWMLLITLLLVLFMLVLFNVFTIKNFKTIPFDNLWIIPWIAIALSLITIFWYGSKNLWDNPRQLLIKTNVYRVNENDVNNDVLPSYQDLQLQLKMLKKQLKEVRNIKSRKR